MKIARKKPGSPKGQSKPSKRQLDNAFAGRLAAAMAKHDLYNEVPALSRAVGCTRAVLLKYLEPGKSKTIESLLLFQIADALNISARWLLTAEGEMGRTWGLAPDERKLLSIYRGIRDKKSKEKLLAEGEFLLGVQPSDQPSIANPFPRAKVTS